ncbi:divergent polysaccharide deacetylase family protein [Phyllobacterium salinisoli]|uniref:Divergent polysaccharide deacetylase family protein n=1 Tax=Phyllobacterium salinisoli TaxID=1899321 RepID=A0A368K5D3_9HYPH|nr:divergent polysaccharide deacetylase family protein [Phyllobacterium salinisoli]RCS23582.1 divergent polysaccharide deacetylase family protein [Phyllobacterium salinisoli]
MSDIHSPLGQNKKQTKRGTGRSRAFRWLGPAAVVAVILATASVFSIGDSDLFRNPPPRPLEAETIVAQPQGSATEIGVNSQQVRSPSGSNISSSGPAIIKVTPEMPALPGTIVVHDPSKVGQNFRVAHLPDPELIENSAMGPLPIRGPDGRRPLDVYARGWSGARGARIAIVVGGLGLSQTGTQNAIRQLPVEVTLAFAPQGNSLQRWMQAARQRGYEILMQVPLEPFDYPRIDPGRHTLTVEGGAEKNRADLLWALSRISNYTGVMNYMGARFTADAGALTPVMQEIGRRGLLYLDDGTSARSHADVAAREQATPFAAADLSIDAVQERGAILKKLDELERIARAKGSAIGTGSAFPVTVEAVAVWANEAKARGIEIVPVSALVRDPERE